MNIWWFIGIGAMIAGAFFIKHMLDDLNLIDLEAEFRTKYKDLLHQQIGQNDLVRDLIKLNTATIEHCHD